MSEGQELKAEGEIATEPETTTTRKKLSRRELLKLTGLLIASRASAFMGIAILDMLKSLFDDYTMDLGCKIADPKEKKHLHETKLKDSYDEVLLVIHPGYELLRSPNRYKDKKGYEKYINDLKQVIKEAKQEGNLVIFLVGAEDIREGRSIEGLGVSDADLTIATHSDGPRPIACVETADHDFISQKIGSREDLADLFIEKSVEKIKLAGEKRSQCIWFAKFFLNSRGFQVEPLEDAIYSPSEK